MSDDVPIGPGVVKRQRRDASPARGNGTSVLSLDEKRQAAHAGEVRRADVQQLLSDWSAFVGPPHPLLTKQMPQFLDEWGFRRLRHAIALVARMEPPPDSSEWLRAQQLLGLFRRWRREK